jgi:putative transposase
VRKSRFRESQIVGILKESESGSKTAELSRRHGVHPHTFYRWKAKYGGMSASDGAKLKQLEEENSRLRRIVANLILDNDALKFVNSKNW